MKSFKYAAVLLLGALTAATASAQITVGVPGSGQGTTYPLGQGAGYTKFQQFMSSSYFTSPFTVDAVTFYRSANSTGTFQQGTFSLYLNTTTTTLANYSTNNPAANEVLANRTLIGTVVIPNATTTAPTITFSGLGQYMYNPALGNLLIDIDFAPVGAQFAVGRATFDTFGDPAGNQSMLVATISDPNVPFGSTAGSRGRGLVTTFGVAATVVPEPSTYALMSAGLAALLVVARRRKLV
jgi:hypothetical protein